MLVSTRNEAAKLLGVTPRQLGTWCHEPWFPADAKSKQGWDVEKIRKARDAAGRKGSDISDEARRLTLEEKREKVERLRIHRERDQLKLERERGRLIPRAGVELFASTILTELADWCDQLPDVIGNTVPTKIRKTLKARIRDELDKRRTNLREQLEREAKNLDSQQEEQ